MNSDSQEDRRINPPRRSEDDNLIAARERLGLAIEAAQVGTFYAPLPLGKLEWNQKCREHFWLDADTEPDIDLFYAKLHPSDREPTRRAIAATLEEGARFDVEYRIVSPTGQIRWIRAMGLAYSESESGPARFDGVTLDITAAKLASQRLRLLNEIADATRTTNEAVEILKTVTGTLARYLSVDRCVYALIQDTQLNIVFDHNPEAALSLEGFDLNDLGDSCFADLSAGRPVVVEDSSLEMEASSTAQSFGRAFMIVPLIKQGAFSAMLSIHQKTSRHWSGEEVETVTEVAGRARSYIEGIQINAELTLQRESLLEAERAARAEAERASRTKDEFLATLSHELRTPLSAILGWAQILKSQPLDSDGLHEAADVIERNARAQTRIIEDLLDLSRIVSGRIQLDFQPMDLRSVVEAAVAAVRPAASAKSIHIELILDEEQFQMRGDAGRLQQVLWNLLNNAIKFTPVDGEVHVHLERLPAAIRASVSDTGEGIGPEFLPYIFDRFRQGDSSSTRGHGGLGIGLSIVRQLVELHGGTVAVRSAGVGQGATFIITLPLAKVVSEPQPPPASASTNLKETQRLAVSVLPSLKGLRILVIDDEDDARAVTRRLLEAQAATVFTAGSAAEALDLLNELRPDVLVSDIGMPGMDGLGLIRHIRSSNSPNSGIPALALTAYARAEDRLRSLAAGFSAHIVKPVDARKLVVTVAKIVANREQQT